MANQPARKGGETLFVKQVGKGRLALHTQANVLMGLGPTAREGCPRCNNMVSVQTGRFRMISPRRFFVRVRLSDEWRFLVRDSPDTKVDQSTYNGHTSIAIMHLQVYCQILLRGKRR